MTPWLIIETTRSRESKVAAVYREAGVDSLLIRNQTCDIFLSIDLPGFFAPIASVVALFCVITYDPLMMVLVVLASVVILVAVDAVLS